MIPYKQIRNNKTKDVNRIGAQTRADQHTKVMINLTACSRKKMT